MKTKKAIKKKKQFRDYTKKKNILHREIREMVNKRRKRFSVQFPKSNKFRKPKDDGKS